MEGTVLRLTLRRVALLAALLVVGLVVRGTGTGRTGPARRQGEGWLPAVQAETAATVAVDESATPMSLVAAVPASPPGCRAAAGLRLVESRPVGDLPVAGAAWRPVAARAPPAA